MMLFILVGNCKFVKFIWRSKYFQNTSDFDVVLYIPGFNDFA